MSTNLVEYQYLSLPKAMGSRFINSTTGKISSSNLKLLPLLKQYPLISIIIISSKSSLLRTSSRFFQILSGLQASSRPCMKSISKSSAYPAELGNFFCFHSLVLIRSKNISFLVDRMNNIFKVIPRVHFIQLARLYQ